MNDNKKPLFNSKTLKNGGYAVVLCVIALAAVVALNLFVSVLPTRYTNLDMTDNKVFSLSDETEQMANALTKDVTLYYLMQSGQGDVAVKQLLDKYAGLSSHIKVQEKDPVLYPTFAASYDASDAAVGSIIVDGGDRHSLVAASDLYTSDYDYTTYTSTTSFDGEAAITSAIISATSDSTIKYYYTAGHGELEISSTIISDLSRQNATTESLTLLTVDAVPDDAAAIIINAPQTDLSSDEAALVTKYLENGGKLMAVTNYGEYSEAAMPNLAAVLKAYGMTAVDGVVIEGDSTRYMSGYPYYLLPKIASSEITDPLVNNDSYVLAPLAHGITIDDNLDSALLTTVLLSTTDSAYNKADAYSQTSIEKADGDLSGAFNVAVLSENSASNSAVVWLSTSGLLDEQTDTYVSGANSDFVLSALSYLAENEQGIAIYSKVLTTATLTVPSGMASFWGGIYMFIVPIAMLVLGLIIWLTRRRR